MRYYLDKDTYLCECEINNLKKVYGNTNDIIEHILFDIISIMKNHSLSKDEAIKHILKTIMI